MVSNAMVTTIVGAGTVAAFMWLGQFTAGIFEDTAAILNDINAGRTPSIVSVISDHDLERLKNFQQEVENSQKNR
jgi:hypothetical protein